MAKISRIEPKTPILVKRKKVAAYARVSMETDRLAHSLSAQVSYYSKLIQGNPEWEYAGVYADYGISGTGVKARYEFRRMISDCEAGEIDIVMTKSISRFARNTVDLLDTVRHLKELGVEVRFEEEHINSFSNDGELMLSILASFAQEESRSTSENLKWAFRKKMQKGELCGGYNLYGYKWTDGKFEIIPEEAAVVKRIFDSYVDGLTAAEIAEGLTADGILTRRKKPFHWGTILQMLKNEKYTGNMLLQKHYRADITDRKQRKNTGQLPQYYIENSHEAIVSIETFNQVQDILKRHRELGAIARKNIPTTCFTRKIKCGCCGANYQRRTLKGVGGVSYKSWMCYSVYKHGRAACPNPDLDEEQLKALCADEMETPAFNDEAFSETVSQITVQGQDFLLLDFCDGRKVTVPWHPIPKMSRSERMKGNIYGRTAHWTDERRKAQSERMKAFHRKRKETQNSRCVNLTGK